MLFIFIFFGLLLGLIYYYLPKRIVSIHKENKKIPYGKYEIVEIESFDGHLLQAYYSPSLKTETQGLVLLLHGIRSQKEIYYGMSAIFAEAGYSTLALDLRAHGRSEGQYCTFGVKERKDVQQWIDYAINHQLLGYNHIGIIGKSLGGAIAIQTLANDARLQFGIIESAMSDFTDTVQHYFHRSIKVSYRPLIQYCIGRAGQLADFDPKEVEIYENCKRIDRPMLLVHGTIDESILIAQGKRNYQALKTTQKQFWEIPNGGHKNLWEIGGVFYYERLVQFMESTNNF